MILAELPTVPDVSVTPAPPLTEAELLIEPVAPEIILAVVLADMTPEFSTVPVVPVAIKLTLEPLEVRVLALLTSEAPLSVIEPVAIKLPQLAVAPIVFVAEILPELLKLPTCKVLAADALLIVTEVGPAVVAL